MTLNVLWHDLECGAYTADLELWRALAERYGEPVLDVGAGTGRTALALARAGRAVTALDQDPELLGALAERADGHAVATVVADAREFDLGARFPLIIVPMQTIQLLGGPQGRGRFLRCARAHLTETGACAVALADRLEPFSVPHGAPAPLPDMCERDGYVYASRPVAVRAVGSDAYLLERRRDTVAPGGALRSERDLVRLDRLTPGRLAREAQRAGLRERERIEIPPTEDHVGSVVVVLGV